MLKIEELENEINGIVDLLTRANNINDVNKLKEELINDIVVLARIKKDEILKNKENQAYLEIEKIFINTKPKTESNLKAICEYKNVSIDDYFKFKNVENYQEYQEIIYMSAE